MYDAFVLAPCVFLALQADPRMDVRATLDAPRATYAEFGAWVQKSTGVPVVVASPIRERKLTVLVEDRPVRETMERVSETLFLQWERTDEGYTLRLDPNVAGEERSAIAALAQARTRALKERLEELAQLKGASLETLASMRDAAQEEADAPHAPVVAQDRLARLKEMAGNPILSEIGGILAAIGPLGRSSLVGGGRLFASSRPEPGMVEISPTSFAILRRSSSKGFVLAMLTGDPESGALQVAIGMLGDSRRKGGTLEIKEGERQTVHQARFGAALHARLRAWERAGDLAPFATKIAPVQGSSSAARPRTLADLLVDLHARTRLSIVADGFRQAVWDAGAPAGESLGQWWNALNRPPAGVRVHPLLGRASKGWLELRWQSYWEYLASEIPEGPIRRLESAVRAHGATLDDVAAFAGPLTAAQVRGLDVDPPVMQAPIEAFSSNVPILRVWNALSPALRRAATTEGGLAIGAGAARRSVENAIAQRCADSGGVDRLTLLLPGASLATPTLRVARDGGLPSNVRYSMALSVLGKTLTFYSVSLGPARDRSEGVSGRSRR